jgi:two-component system OmpR family response regulator
MNAKPRDPSPTILVVDDDPHIAEVLEFALVAAGFQVLTETTGPGTLDAIEEKLVDLVILDINLPGPDGLWVCRKIREFSDVPIIFLSARDEEVDRIMGLSLGGDDYVTKPFSPRELVARVEAVLRRQKTLDPQNADKMRKETDGADQARLAIGPLTLDFDSFEAFYDGALVELTAMEFKILKAMVQRPKKVFSRDELLSVVSPDVVVSDRTVDSHILHIRKKFQKAGGDVIATQHGLGYSLANLADKGKNSLLKQ